MDGGVGLGKGHSETLTKARGTAGRFRRPYRRNDHSRHQCEGGCDSGTTLEDVSTEHQILEFQESFLSRAEMSRTVSGVDFYRHQTENPLQSRICFSEPRHLRRVQEPRRSGGLTADV